MIFRTTIPIIIDLIITFSINDSQHTNTLHKSSSVLIQFVAPFYHYAGCSYAECRCADFHEGVDAFVIAALMQQHQLGGAQAAQW